MMKTLSADHRLLHERLLVLDTHLDVPYSFTRQGWDIMDRHDVRTDISQTDYPRMVEGGLDGGFFVVFTWQRELTPQGYARARDAALLRAVEIREMVAKNPDHFELALSAADAPRIAREGKRVVFISIENGYPIGEDISLLKTFYNLGVRLAGPVHMANNQLGDSSTDDDGPRWNGLSPLGMEFVAEANRLGILLDASHASDDVLDQMMSLSKTPIILSHSGSKTILDHPRNVDDDRLRRLAASGGVVHVIMASDFLVDTPMSGERLEAMRALGKKFGSVEKLPLEQAPHYIQAQQELDEKFPIPIADFDLWLRQMLHIINVVGVDHVGLGIDFDGGGGGPDFKDVTDLPRITSALCEAGYSEDDLAKIMSGNVLRVLKQAEDHARSVAASRR